MSHSIFTLAVRTLATLALTSQLLACNSEDIRNALTDNVETLQVSKIGGSVGDGPIIGATLNVYSKNGKLLYTEVSDSQARYNSQISAPPNQYPLTIEVSGGIDLVTQRAPDFKLSSLVMSPGGSQVVNINPYTTLVVELARTMKGGLKNANLQKAKETVYKQMNFGLDLALVPDPMTSEITGENVSAIVKSSEALGELIRRTHLRTTQIGMATDIQGTIEMLAKDLGDGVLDGSASTDVRVANILHLSTAEVTLESMRNELRVDQINVAAALDDSILYVHPETPMDRLADSVAVNQEILDQARYALNQLVSLDAGLQNLAADVETIQVGDLPGDLANKMITTTTLEAFAGALMAEETVVLAEAEPVVHAEPVVAVVEETQVSSASVATDTTVTTEVVESPVVSQPVVYYAEPVVVETIVIESIEEPILLEEPVQMDVVEEPAQPVVEEETVVVNGAPVLSGVPPTEVLAGGSYEFTPGVTDPDNDSLFFTIRNRPAWLNFRNENGRIFGKPDATEVGLYEGITITVTDGSESVALGPFSIQVTEAMVEAAAEPSTELAEEPQTATRKFNPGHYISMNRYDKQSDMVNALKPGVAGIQKRYYWKQLETSYGVYDFSLVLSDLDILAAQGSRLVVFIEDKTFNGEIPTPDYLQADYTLKNRNRGYTAKRWDPYVITRFKALIAEMGRQLDKHPALEGIAIQESSLSLDNTILNANGYTPEKYRDGLIDVLTSAAGDFPTSQVFWYMNFFAQHQSYIRNIAYAVAKAGVTVGGPDVLPGEYSLETHCYPMYDDFKGKMVLFNSMQYNSYDHPHEGSEYATKYWTMGEMFRFARDKLHVQYLFWNRKVSKGGAPDSYNWLDALPVIENNPLFNS